MSTFSGKLDEEGMDFIRIDNFQANNIDGKVFLLSHFHSDHYRGLYTIDFIEDFLKGDKVIYCTSLTKQLLLSKFNNNGYESQLLKLGQKVNVIDTNSPLALVENDREVVVVTSIPAGHCPGAVMFLLEQGDTRVLYTGDFRLGVDELSKITALHNKNPEKSLKKITSLYLDTTFCSKDYKSFPTRDQSVALIFDTIDSWLNADPFHQVGIYYNSLHGSEFLLYEVFKRFKIKIDVVDLKAYENYQLIPDIFIAFTRDGSKIHLCPVSGSCLTCEINSRFVKRIKPCAMTFTTSKLALHGPIATKPGELHCRICYSQHCSLHELIDAVKYMKPEKIHPCVLPPGTTEEQFLAEFKNLLNEDSLFPRPRNAAFIPKAVPSVIVSRPSTSNQLVLPKRVVEIDVTSETRDPSLKGRIDLTIDTSAETIVLSSDSETD